MAKKLNDMIGKKFNSLVALSFFGFDNKKKCKNATWLFQCDCGNTKVMLGSPVKRGKIKTCGCSRAIIGQITKTHGLSKTPEYSIWRSMKARCLNIKNAAYENYGGRGIKVCDEWVNSYETFLKNMGSRPNNQYTLERINNDLGYSKENCKWATRREQILNRRNTVKVEYLGEVYPLIELCSKLNKNYNSIKSYLHIGGDISNRIVGAKLLTK